MPAGLLAAVGRQKLRGLLIAHQLERKTRIGSIRRILSGTLLHNTDFREEDNAHIGNLSLLCQL